MNNKLIEKIGEQADDYTDDKIQMLAEQALVAVTTDGAVDEVYRPMGFVTSASKAFTDKFAELLIKEIVSELQFEIHRSCRTLTYDLDDHIKMDAREDALDDALLIVKSILE